MLDVAMLSPRFPFKGIIPPKRNKCSLAKNAARVNWGTAANRTFEAVLLQFVTFDVDDAKAHRYAPRKFALAADLGDGVEIDNSRSWVHVDRRVKGSKSYARVNLNHIVFTARCEKLELSFTDAEAKIGERLGLNWIYFAKYVGEEMFDACEHMPFTYVTRHRLFGGPATALQRRGEPGRNSN